jgi:uncharacterized membrane protein YbhN (UPF0104 family)
MAHKHELDRSAPAGDDRPDSAEAPGAPAAAPKHDSPPTRGRSRWRWLRRALHVAVPAAVIALVARELASIDWSRAAGEIARAHRAPIAWAALATLVCLANMGLYDVLAMSRGSTLSRVQRWMLGAAICSWTNFLAIGPLAGPALRLHFYRRAGMDLIGVARGLAGIYAGMFSGIAAWIAAMYLPLPPTSVDMAARGAIALALAPLLCLLVGGLIYRFRRDVALEDARTYAALGVVAALEWGLVATVYTLVARAVGAEAPVDDVAKSFFVGHVAGAASLLPGGLGSADAVWLKLNLAHGSAAAVAAAHVLLFRCVYFLGPWGLSLIASIAYVALRSLGGARRRDAEPRDARSTHAGE